MFGDVIKQQDSNGLSFERLEVLSIYLLFMCNPWGKTPSLNLNMFHLSNMKRKIHVKVWICRTI
jgi:hypothetical protein